MGINNFTEYLLANTVFKPDTAVVVSRRNSLQLSTLDETKRPLQIHLFFVSEVAWVLEVRQKQNGSSVYSWEFVGVTQHPV